MTTKKLIKHIAVVLIVGLLISCNSKPDPRIDEIDKIFNNLHQNERFNGNILIAEKGKIIYEKSFGYANIEKKDTLDNSSIFNIASISKTFTSVCIMMLEEEGLLSLDDNIKTYFPNCPYENITIKNLLTHTSGLTRIQSQPFRKEIEGKGYNNNQIKDIYFKIAPKQHFESGAHHYYANTNYLLLALIIEEVSNKSFNDFLVSRVFKKADMNHSFLRKKRVPQKLADYVVSCYTKPTWLSNNFEDVSNLENRISDDSTFANDYGISAIHTTARDLLKYHEALQKEILLSKESLKKMYTSISLKDNKEYTISPNSNYPSLRGLAWCVSKDDPNMVYHSGGSIGGRNFLIRNLEKDQCAIVLANNEEMNKYNVTFPMKVLNNQDYKLGPISLPREFCNQYLEKGIDEAVNFYKTNIDNEKYTSFIDYDFEEIGGELMSKKDTKASIELYKLYVAAIPDEFSWELLGNAYLEDNNIKKAKECLENSVQINPKHQSAFDSLKIVENILGSNFKQ